MSSLFESNALPSTAEELVERLDKDVPLPAPTVRDLADEQGRLALAEEIGRRKLVEQLMFVMNRQREGAK